MLELNKIHCGDCSDLLKKIDFNKIGAIIIDPPYGVSKEVSRNWHGNNGKVKFNGRNAWDEKLDSLVKSLSKLDKDVIIWGGNFYDLGPTDSWLIWDKLQDGRSSDAELAWAKVKKRGCRVFRMSRIDAYFNKRFFPKEHPTEKPIQLMKWCVEKTSGVVLDCFAGSGSTLIACKLIGRDFIGIEINEKYARIANERLKETQFQGKLFVSKKRK
jgi:DNA modification methylase|tara:strand:- start:113 stop:754 length:642 start_codon:yes stop_codon:yes gene_type:complete